MGDNSRIGNMGEEQALRYLLSHGFTILHRNWRSGRYELDIVARTPGTIHFVEVKCRRARSLTTPEEAITPAKFASLQKAATAYIAMYDIQEEIQFDLIAVEHSPAGINIRYIPAAMTCSW